jgi:hypothetical protein
MTQSGETPSPKAKFPAFLRSIQALDQVKAPRDHCAF